MPVLAFASAAIRRISAASVPFAPTAVAGRPLPAAAVPGRDLEVPDLGREEPRVAAEYTPPERSSATRSARRA
eukprot:5130307-Pyramimonas_sp.AAC.1